jgi:hypothetical protein
MREEALLAFKAAWQRPPTEAALVEEAWTQLSGLVILLLN